MPVLTYMTNRSIDIYLTTEDLPHPDALNPALTIAANALRVAAVSDLTQ